MFVRITAGTYGYRDDKGHLKPKNSGDTVLLDDAEAERLINLGVAEEISTEEAGGAAPEVSDESAINNTPNGEKAEEMAGNEVVVDEMAIEDMTFDQLKSVAEQMGLPHVGKYRSKKALMDAIEAESLGAAEPEVG